jgi:hypothetical protein
VITKKLAISEETPANEMHKRIKPVQRASEREQPVGGEVPAADVQHFVKQHVACLVP